MKPNISGFLKNPKRSANKKIYKGRFTCPNVQWTGSTADLMATFTITADELADAAATNLLWTDQDVQRGIKPHVTPIPARELNLAAGYPDTKMYNFQAENADDMAEKLLHGEKLFLNPLIWSLRPGTFEAYWNESDAELFVYDGRIYLPDSHHRHQAIIKAVAIWRSAQKDYPRFHGDKEFKVELYFLSREDEGNYFFDKNQRPKPTEKSKAYDLTTLDDLSILAKKVIEKSSALQGNVNRVTDRLTAKNPQLITLSTLREMMRTFASADDLDTSELNGLAAVAAGFFDMLASVRPELGKKDVNERRAIREASLVDAAVMMHGYAAVMKDYNSDIAKYGTAKAKDMWQDRLQRLLPDHAYKIAKWSGDFFDKNNPLWRLLGIVKPGRDGKRLTVLNTGAARSECGRVLRQLLAVDAQIKDLSFLTNR